MLRLRLSTVVLFLVSGLLRADERIEVGPVRLDVHISQTATLFHIVDQVSEWSYYTHRQYGRFFAPLSAADQMILSRHKAVRAKHSWGEGLEQTFYTPAPLDEALRAGVAAGWLTAGEAKSEREVLLGFAGRADALLTAQAGSLDRFTARLREELGSRRELLEQMSRLVAGAPELIPVYLVPNPDSRSIGGGLNGGRLTVEVPTDADAVPTAIHELFHAFLDLRDKEIARATESAPSLDAETLKEGLAYALAPGLVHLGSPADDPLAGEVQRGYRDGRSFDDPLTRYNRYALALRPLLRDALADSSQDLRTFLPRAVDVWRAVAELEKARAELHAVTLLRLYRRESPELPDFVRKGMAEQKSPTEYFVGSKEWIAGLDYRQMSDFLKRAGKELRFTAAGRPGVRARLNGHCVSRGDGTFQAYGIEIVDEDRDKIVRGIAYVPEPVNTSDRYRWQVAPNFAPFVLRE